MIRAARTDDERRVALKLLALTGREARLDHRRAELRRDLAYILAWRISDPHEPAIRRELDEVHREWGEVIKEIRTIRSAQP